MGQMKTEGQEELRRLEAYSHAGPGLAEGWGRQRLGLWSLSLSAPRHWSREPVPCGMGNMVQHCLPEKHPCPFPLDFLLVTPSR